MGGSGGAFFPRADAQIVSHVGRYRVVCRLGIGRTSEVLLAEAIGPFEIERTVVLKRLLPSEDEIRPRLFAREAVAYARLNHPAIVRLYDVIAEGGELAIVLEHVDGCSLARLLEALRARGERLPDAAAAFVAMRVFAALEAAHDAKGPSGAPSPIIHRDVTPSNVLVPWDGFAKLADFGLAKVPGLSSDTRTGLLKGTYGYMAPEQVLGEPITTRTDVYQAMLVTYELLRGVPAFVRGSVPEIDLLHAMADSWIVPIELARPELPLSLVRAIHLGLANDPDERAISAGAMVDLLRATFDLEAGRCALAAALEESRLSEVPAPVHVASTPSREIDLLRLEMLRSVRPPPPSGVEPIRTSTRPPPPISATNEVSLPTVRPPGTPLEESVANALDAPPRAIPLPPRLPDFGARAEAETQPDVGERVSRVASVAPPVAAVPAPVVGSLATPRVRVPMRAAADLPLERAPSTQRLHTTPVVRPVIDAAAIGSGTSLEPPGTTTMPSIATSEAIPAQGRGWIVAVVVSAIAALVALAWAGSAILRSRERATPMIGRIVSPRRTLALAPAPPPATSAPVPSSKTGIMTTPASAAGHRVFLDGRVVGSGGERREVACGKHVVRVGSLGRDQSIDVPCGGEIAVSR